MKWDLLCHVKLQSGYLYSSEDCKKLLLSETMLNASLLSFVLDIIVNYILIVWLKPSTFESLNLEIPVRAYWELFFVLCWWWQKVIRKSGRLFYLSMVFFIKSIWPSSAVQCSHQLHASGMYPEKCDFSCWIVSWFRCTHKINQSHMFHIVCGKGIRNNIVVVDSQPLRSW